MSWIAENTTVWRRGSLRRLRLIALVLALAASSTGCSILWRLSPLFPPRAHTVSLSDLDGDGDLDAVVGNGPDNVDYPGEPNRVWLNDGAGRFRDSGQRLVSTGASGWEVTHAVALGDIDGDGDTDAVFGDALFLNVRSSDTVWINDGAGQFTLYAEPRLKPEGDHFVGRSEAVRLGDLDGDGDLDLFVGNCCRNEWGSNTQHGYSDAHNLVWLNDGAGYFVDSGQQLSRASGEAVALGDLDGDSDLDAFVGNTRFLNSDEVWFNDGQGRFTDSGQRLGDGDTHTVALDDVDGDGDQDVFAIQAKGSCLVWHNDGTGRFTFAVERGVLLVCLAAGGAILLGAVVWRASRGKPPRGEHSP